MSNDFPALLTVGTPSYPLLPVLQGGSMLEGGVSRSGGLGGLGGLLSGLFGGGTKNTNTNMNTNNNTNTNTNTLSQSQSQQQAMANYEAPAPPQIGSIQMPVFGNIPAASAIPGFQPSPVAISGEGYTSPLPTLMGSTPMNDSGEQMSPQQVMAQMASPQLPSFISAGGADISPSQTFMNTPAMRQLAAQGFSPQSMTAANGLVPPPPPVPAGQAIGMAQGQTISPEQAAAQGLPAPPPNAYRAPTPQGVGGSPQQIATQVQKLMQQQARLAGTSIEAERKKGSVAFDDYSQQVTDGLAQIDQELGQEIQGHIAAEQHYQGLAEQASSTMINPVDAYTTAHNLLSGERAARIERQIVSQPRSLFGKAWNVVKEFEGDHSGGVHEPLGNQFEVQQTVELAKAIMSENEKAANRTATQYQKLANQERLQVNNLRMQANQAKTHLLADAKERLNASLSNARIQLSAVMDEFKTQVDSVEKPFLNQIKMDQLNINQENSAIAYQNAQSGAQRAEYYGQDIGLRQQGLPSLIEERKAKAAEARHFAGGGSISEKEFVDMMHSQAIPGNIAGKLLEEAKRRGQVQ